MDGWLKHLDMITLDAIALQLAFWLAYALRHGGRNPYVEAQYRNLAILLLLTDVLFLLMTPSLDGVMQRGFWKEMCSCLQNAVFITMISTFYLFAVQGGQKYSRMVLFLTGAMYFVLNTVSRILWKELVRHRNSLWNERAMLVAAPRKQLPDVLQHLCANRYEQGNIKGLSVLDEEGSPREESCAASL